MNKIHLNLDEIQGVIFDIDGVLVDTEYDQWQAWVEALKPYGKSLTKQDYLKYAGKQGDIIEAELINNFNLNLKEKTVLSKKEEIVINRFKSKGVHLMPYAKEAVTFFLQKQMKLTCATGSPEEEAHFKLGKAGLSSFFKNFVSGTDVKRGKPFPDIYVLAANSLTVKPASCLAFEDTQYGVASAKSAGLLCIALPNEFSQQQDFSQADGIFSSLQEAIAWITEQ